MAKDVEKDKADVELADKEVAIGVETVSVQVVVSPPDKQDPDPASDYSDAFDAVTVLVVDDKAKTTVGAILLAECQWCGALLRPDPQPLKTHLKFHIASFKK